jgi:hypothetical protein
MQGRHYGSGGATRGRARHAAAHVFVAVPRYSKIHQNPKPRETDIIGLPLHSSGRNKVIFTPAIIDSVKRPWSLKY